jgi:hypothetical protein
MIRAEAEELCAMEIHFKVTIDDRLVNAARAVRSKLSRRRAAALLGLSVACTTLAVLAAPVDKAHTFEAGDPIRASEINANFDALYAELNARVIRNDQTVEAADCAALKAALSSLQDRRIVADATVTIELAEGESSCGSGTSVVVDHPDGGHIRIVGQGSGETTLTFFNADGFVIPMSRSVGQIDKLSITRLGGNGNGVVVLGAASAKVGPDVIVRDFEIGVYAEGGWIRADGVLSESNADAGFEAYAGGFIWADGATARANGSNGFQAILGSGLRANDALAQSNGLFGFDANVGSTVYVDGAASSGSQHGFNANSNGTLVARHATASGEFFGYAAWNAGYIQAFESEANDAVAGGYSARSGSFAHVTTPSGNAVSYGLSGANTFYAPEGSFVMQD